uniref:NEK6-subfamily protein kinase n=1 Tax=Panagrellus redivivus TaxID=6233 RepID=A0A7E4ZX30_PANRE
MASSSSSLQPSQLLPTESQMQAIYGKFEHMEIGKQIGKGQFSEVFRALNNVNGEMVAMKKIQLHVMKDKKAREDCLKEIDLLRQLNHENVIKYYASYIVDKDLYIVLELADAGDLSKLIRQFKKNHRLLPERTIWKYFVQICRALAYMHSKRVMHRDLKPANVFLTKMGVVKLGDLGLGRFFSTQTYNAHSVVGTPYYMSPERMNSGGYNFKSDIWSIGCLLYEMAALQSPFFGVKINIFALIRKIDRCEYPPIPSDIYSAQMRSLISNCICNDSTKRMDAQQVAMVAEQMHAYFTQQHQQHHVRRQQQTPQSGK